MLSYGWGSGSFGQLGNQALPTAQSLPALVVGTHLFTKLAAGGNTSGALKGDGSAWAWGNAVGGSLGNNTISSVSSPILVVGNHNFVDIHGGAPSGAGSFFLARKATGETWAWGSNGSGQLGDNSQTGKSSPILVTGAHAFTAISCGEGTDGGGIAHSAALKGNGQAWCWGAGGSGELGDNAATGRSSPVLVVGAHLFTAIGCGTNHTVALKATGEAWAWGDNGGGKLGDQTITQRNSPVLVVGAHSFTALSVGGAHTAALKSDGSVWAWGKNTNGKLGDQSATNRSSPVLVVGAHSFITIVAASNATYGMKANGEMWAWGQNDVGQLADGSLTNRSSPVLVTGSYRFIGGAGGASHMLGLVSPSGAGAGGRFFAFF